ncbi:MAG: hypothetical protein ACOZBZ_02415 [Patescibacteria group bacterium]
MAHTIFHHLFIAFRAVVRGLVLLAVWIAVSLTGVFFWSQFSSPINLVLGAPLFLIGLTMGLSALYEAVVGVISWRWGRTHCPFCEPPKEVKKILSPYDGFK